MVSGNADVAAGAARRRALDFLAARALARGEVPLTCRRAREASSETPDRSLFATSLAAVALADLGESRVERFRDLAAARLLAEREPGGLWRFWPRDHPRHRESPPDLDDSAAAALAIRSAGGDPAVDRRLLLGQRDRTGRLHTWLVPRSLVTRLVGPLARGRRHASASHPFWQATEASREDVDAGANAQALALFPRAPEGGAAASWLVEVVRSGIEEASDHWYRSGAMVRYLIARALARGAEALAPARPLLAAAIGRDRDAIVGRAQALELALALTTALSVEADECVEPLLGALVAVQAEDGGYERAAVWYGGPKRSVDWGSRELTTVFALEALWRFSALGR